MARQSRNVANITGLQLYREKLVHTFYSLPTCDQQLVKQSEKCLSTAATPLVYKTVLPSMASLVAQAPAYNCQSASECIPYRLHGTSLHCSGVFSECDYVLPGSNLSSVEMAENQLGEVIRRAESGVTQDCFNGFVSLYCHQVYVPCQETPGGQYMTLVQPLCHSDCQAVIETSCSVTQWSYLENIVKTARDNGTTQTPPLRSTCTDLPSNLGNCTTISGGM